MFAFELDDQALDALALQAQIATRRAAAADDRQLALLAVLPRLVLAHVDERTDDDVLAVVGDEPRRHRLQRPGEEQVEEERLDEVVEMVAERDLRGADLGGDSVEDAAPEPGTERAGRRVGLEQVVHHLADGRVLDAVLPPALLARLRDDAVLEVLVARVDVDGEEGERKRRALLQHVQHLHQRSHLYRWLFKLLQQLCQRLAGHKRRIALHVYDHVHILVPYGFGYTVASTLVLLPAPEDERRGEQLEERLAVTVGGEQAARFVERQAVRIHLSVRVLLDARAEHALHVRNEHVHSPGLQSTQRRDEAEPACRAPRTWSRTPSPVSWVGAERWRTRTARWPTCARRSSTVRGRRCAGRC